MRIIHILNSADPQNGGTAEAVRGIADGQAKLGHEITVISTGDSKLLPDSHPGVRWHIHRLKLRAWKWSPDFALAVSDLVKNNDIVHLHTLWEFPISEGARVSAILKKPFLLSPHGMLDRWALSQHALKKMLYSRLVLNKILNHAKAVHFTSDGEYRNSLMREKELKGFICPLGVDLSNPTNADLQVFYKNWPALKARQFVLFLGRLHYKKQPELVIESFWKIHNKMEGLFLVMAGPAEAHYLNRLKKRVHELALEDRVVFTGMLNRSLVSAALRLADVFVLPSLQENFGLSVAEAMAASCPVIVSRAVNLSDDIEASGAGIVCQPAEDQLTEALVRILSDSSLSRRMGQNGRALILNKFQWTRSSEMIVHVYEDILGGRRSCPAWITP